MLSADHRRMWALAFPMMLSNLTIPLLGMVDTAVMGHLPSAQYIGGVSIGAMIFSFIFWGFAFLRMGTTGLTAQAFGAGNTDEVRAMLARTLLLAVLLSFVLLLMQWPLKKCALYWVEGSIEVEALAAAYFDIRIWALPAVLLRYVLIGWFLGMQNARAPLYLLVSINALNVILDIVFVVFLGLAVEGVAWATLIAEYAGMGLSLLLAVRVLKSHPGRWCLSDIIDGQALQRMLSVNRDIFLRTLVLIFCFAFFTAKSAEMGDQVLAANTVLMNLLLFMAYGLDGFAHAVEALAGRALGARQYSGFMRYVKVTGQWSLITAALFCMAYFFCGKYIIGLQTDIPSIYVLALEYLPWLIVIPLISVWAFWLDGVFIAATRGSAMRNTMLCSGVLYLLVWFFAQPLGNHGLWLAMLSYMAIRGLLLGAVFIYIDRRDCFGLAGPV